MFAWQRAKTLSWLHACSLRVAGLHLEAGSLSSTIAPSGRRRLYRSIWTRITLGTSIILARVRPASPRRAGVTQT